MNVKVSERHHSNKRWSIVRQAESFITGGMCFHHGIMQLCKLCNLTDAADLYVLDVMQHAIAAAGHVQDGVCTGYEVSAQRHGSLSIEPGMHTCQDRRGSVRHNPAPSIMVLCKGPRLQHGDNAGSDNNL